jgi:hypothetical protein
VGLMTRGMGKGNENAVIEMHYKPLCFAKSEIRLLKLIPSESHEMPLECRL